MTGCLTDSEGILAATTPNLPFMIKNSLKADRHRNIMFFNKMYIEFFITSWNLFIVIESSLEDFSCVNIYISLILFYKFSVTTVPVKMQHCKIL